MRPPISETAVAGPGPVGPTNVSDALRVFAQRTPRAGILTRDRWIGRRLKWHIEWKKPDLWIGVFWRDHPGEMYGTTFLYAREVWVCVLPCLPLCITFYGEHGPRRRLASSEERHDG